MPSAREFYFSVVAPDEFGLSYQRVHHAPQRDEDFRRAASHVPRRSNDILIDSYVDELDQCCSADVAAWLNDVFVAKQHDFVANAAALYPEDQYDGHLVFFNVGLSDACFQYSTLFAEFAQLRGRGGDSHLPQRSTEMLRLLRDSAKLAAAQTKWSSDEGFVGLQPGTVLEAEEDIENVALSIATFMDKFVLCHELAHHILGHTGIKNGAFDALQAQIGRFMPNCCPATHAREHAADVAAMLLPFSGTEAADRDGREADVVLGALLVLTVLGQMPEDPSLPSDRHPSPASRFDVCLDVVRATTTGRFVQPIVDDVVDFQRLLFATQERGLGCRLEMPTAEAEA